MRTNRTSYDVVVVGAGPAGSAAAIAHARKGAQVLLLEADPRAANRFAGEWMHPTGVAVLDELRIGRLERARARAGYGFVIFADDREEAIELPYSNGVALSGEHCELVYAIREAAASHTSVEYVPEARVVRIEDDLVEVECRRTSGSFSVRAGRIVGADGRRSAVRQSLGFEDRSAALSYMAAVELRGVSLPREGFGHVVLGGPGPALFYRISDDVIRGCLDLPIALGAKARTTEFLWDGFGPVLPEPLRTAMRAALERGVSGWAINRFRPRTQFGRGRVALIGDAVGHVHPMTAIGMTMGLNDARALANARTVDEYAKARRAYIPELLSNALYHCFRRDDDSATQVRRAMFKTLRADDRERRRTMEILAGSDLRRRSFGSAFLRIAMNAMTQTVVDTTGKGELARLPIAIAGFGEWMQWPAAIVMPSRFDATVRANSSSTHPIPQLERLVPTAAPVRGVPEDDDRLAADSRDVPLADAIDRGSQLLLTELERIAMRIGTVPDAALATPALSCMRAIVATRMRIGMAARMTLGRRRLAVEGFPRLFANRGEPSARHLAELLLVLLDGASWEELPIASLAEGVRALIDRQREDGAFAHEDGEHVLEVTALACRAIDVLSRRRPEATDADLARVLLRAAAWVRAQQHEDGSWPDADRVSATAWAIEAILCSHGHPGEPAVRRAVRWLAQAAEREGGFGFERDRAASARALRAMVLCGGTANDAIVATARWLASELEIDDAMEWSEARELVEALAACEARRAMRPRKARRSAAPTTVEPAAMSPELAADFAFCKESLAEVSRTFSRPIALLPPRLEVCVTLGYLLCRVADTIEDHVAVDASIRDGLFRLFLDVLEGRGDPEAFAAAFVPIEGDDAELVLARAMPRVMRVFDAQDERSRIAMIRWVSEMARGMNLYTSRQPGEDGLYALHTVADLDRYCYYVAGTVGHLLTDLFLAHFGEDPDSARAIALRDKAEGFASGLQLTNILKDVTDDFARAVSFVPRTECARQGFAVARLIDPAVRSQAHAAVGPLFELARTRLDEALEYSLAIPADQPQIRLFCLLPLWMAARTLVMARGNDAMFTPGMPVKISRAEVEALIAECVRLVADDSALRMRYAQLYDTRELGTRAG